ncbi:branched-chain amino acid ABC transporter permease [Salinibaculum salinum]|uniref:branched-chain amino acid ABC transporter permease n=1 Tax=Salinibaculum salinum TaxID=3131996 RepID=UPI003A96A450
MLSCLLSGGCTQGVAAVAATGLFDAGGPFSVVGVSVPDAPILAQLIVFAVLLGGIYGLVALGLTMIFGVMDVINFAHGALMVVAMYALLYISEATGVSPFLVIPFAVLLLFLLGAGIYRVTIAPIIEAPQENQLIVTFGVLLILVSTIEIIFGSDPRSLDLDLGSFDVAGVFIPEGQLYALIIALVALVGTYLFLQRTMLGRAIRGTADNRDGAQYVGINVPRIDALTFGIGAALAGLAGAVVPLFQSFTPFLGDRYLINAFVVVVLGGLGSFPGAFLGGLVVGFLQVFGSFYLDGSLYQVVIFLVFILVLLVKPEGLLGGSADE